MYPPWQGAEMIKAKTTITKAEITKETARMECQDRSLARACRSSPSAMASIGSFDVAATRSSPSDLCWNACSRPSYL